MQSRDFFNELEHQENPLSALNDFLTEQDRLEQSQQVDKMRFVGYVLEIGYDEATIITSDPYKVAVGGIPRGSFLILAPSDLDGLPPHFTLLRVMETAPTPLSMQVQQTYFELHKKSMPELDRWTQSELQWGALKCAVLGMFYPNPSDQSKIAFSGDVNSVVSAHRYRVYAPNEELLEIIVNGLVQPMTGEALAIGYLRPTENELATLLLRGNGAKEQRTTVKVSVDDFKGTRTAMFGKTRLGKSNVVKVLAQAVIDATSRSHAVGQLIFDLNGEYANDNATDGSKSIRSMNEDVCDVYALTARQKTPSKPLRLNFYEQPDASISILGSLLLQDSRKADYIESFTSVELPSIDAVGKLGPDERTRPVRLIQAFWTILHEAGFQAREEKLEPLFRTSHGSSAFDPHFKQAFRDKVYEGGNKPDPPRSLADLAYELKQAIKYARANPEERMVKDLFKADDWALFGLLLPKSQSSSGPAVLTRYRTYHHQDAGDFVGEILRSLDKGRTVILDLGNATDKIRTFFSEMLSREVFAHQEVKFTSDTLGTHFIHLYFEEAHNLFPVSEKDLTGVYARFAKEGAKFHIGMTYSTQSPSTIYGELLSQTENFFIGHLSSSDDTRTLARLQRAYAGLEEEIMRSRTPGYMRMLTKSHRFVVPLQARLFEAASRN